MNIQDYKNKHTNDKLQVVAYQQDGKVVNSCNSIFEIVANGKSSIYDILPILKEHNAQALYGVKVGGGETYKTLNIFNRKEGDLRIAILEDVSWTEEISMGDRVSRLEDELTAIKKLQQIKLEHFSKITHDIKLPLTEIIGTGYLLRNFVSDDRGKDYINALSQSAKTLDMMLNDLLSFSRSEAYDIKFEAKNFLLDQVLGAVIRTFEYKASEKNIPIEIQMSERVPNYLIGDPNRLSQIIYNLVDNALKFTNSGSINIDIDCAQEDANSCELSFKIRDTGVGIPQDKLQSIFEAYQQAKEKDSKKGFGLGLSIVKQLVELHQGTISVESKLGEGATFAFTLKFALPRKSAAN